MQQTKRDAAPIALVWKGRRTFCTLVGADFSGVKVETLGAIPLDTPVALEWRTGSPDLPSMGTVIWVRRPPGHPATMGVQFDELDMDELAALTQLVSGLHGTAQADWSALPLDDEEPLPELLDFELIDVQLETGLSGSGPS